jgi:hypothetical protein
MNTQENSKQTLSYYNPKSIFYSPKVVEVDICIYGATSAGVAAAVQAAMLGKKVALVDIGHHIGGMTTSGLSATDIGNTHVIGGLSRRFYRDCGRNYGQEESWFFEPKIAMKVYSSWIKEHNIPVYQGCPLVGTEKHHNKILSFDTEDGSTFKAKVFIDATYEGDLMARSGVRFTYGRESNSQYDELFNGIYWGSSHHNFIRFVDPYRKAGNPSSGLLPGVSQLELGIMGEGDSLIQAYNFRMCLTKNERNKIPFPKPNDYDPEKYELLRRYIDIGVFDIFNLTRAVQLGKYDHNNWGAFNTDYIGGNYEWPDGDYKQREKIFQDHVNYQQGLLWFCANEAALPEEVRKITNEWGLAADEFVNTNNWPPQLYVREARRMVSDYVITEHDALGRYQVEDSIGMASYRMDSHNCKRISHSGRIINEGNVEIAPLSPIAIPYRAIIPKRQECENLLVPVCLSASHIGYGAVRMEPVFMILGQSAAVAADLACSKNGVVQDVSYTVLEEALVSSGQIVKEPQRYKSRLKIAQ